MKIKHKILCIFLLSYNFKHQILCSEESKVTTIINTAINNCKEWYKKNNTSIDIPCAYHSDPDKKHDPACDACNKITKENEHKHFWPSGWC